MTLIKQASRAIEQVTARAQVVQRAKYARRNKLRYLDKLLNELEMLNLAGERHMPQALLVAISNVVAESPGISWPSARQATLMEAMDALYEIQDSLMYSQIEDV